MVEALVANIERFMRSTCDADSAHALVRGAFHAISDPGTADDDDPIVKQLLAIDELLPPEQ